jgi:hypothetical protein
LSVCWQVVHRLGCQGGCQIRRPAYMQLAIEYAGVAGVGDFRRGFRNRKILGAWLAPALAGRLKPASMRSISGFVGTSDKALRSASPQRSSPHPKRAGASQNLFPDFLDSLYLASKILIKPNNNHLRMRSDLCSQYRGAALLHLKNMVRPEVIDVMPVIVPMGGELYVDVTLMCDACDGTGSVRRDTEWQKMLQRTIPKFRCRKCRKIRY